MQGSVFKYLIVAVILWILAYVYYENYLLKRRESHSLANKIEHISRQGASNDNEHTASNVVTPAPTAQDRAEQARRSVDEFRDIHRKIVEGKRPPKVIYNIVKHSGYANFVYSFISTIFIGMLTERAVILNNWPQINDFIAEPLYKTYDRFNDAQDHPMRYKIEETTEYPDASLVIYHVKKNYTDLITMQVENENVTRYRIPWGSPYVFLIGSNPAYYEKLYKFGLVERQTLDNALEKIQGGDKYTSDEKSEAVLRIGFQVGQELLRLFWQPTAYIARLVEENYNANFKGHYVIGLQIRTEFLMLDKELKGLLPFFECALMIERSIDAGRKIRWFVSTDAHWIKEDYAHKYGRNKVFGTDMSNVNMTLNYDDQRIVIDNELLSKCDEIVMTGGSTFGFLAAMRKGILPYYVNGNLNMTECKRSVLSNAPARKHWDNYISASF